MKNDDIEVLAGVFCSVLERESFMFGDVIDKDEGVTFGTMHKAVLTFTGDLVSGEIALVLPEQLSLELAANMLGAETDENFVKEQANDALGELLNVLCGQFLTTVEGEIPIFDLSVPIVTIINDSDWNDLLKSDHSILLMVEDEYNVLISLKVKS